MTLAAAPIGQAAETWPRLIGGAETPQCQQAYKLGVAAFRSDNAALSWPMKPPDDLGSRFVLRRRKIDISGGDGLAREGEVFSVTRAPGLGDRVLWTTQATGGARVAILEESVGWRGDLYSAYVLEASAAPDSLFGSGGGSRDTGRFKPFVDQTWTPPVVLEDETSRRLWLIEFAPFQHVGPWKIHTFDRGEVRLACRVVFHPPMQTEFALLPASVRRWAGLLDEALGPGHDEGTLQPTARIRLEVRNAWVNASVRPWALIAPPYNTTAEVNAGLAKWASVGKARRDLLRDLNAGRPAAQRDLASYYRARFELAPAQARRASAYILDYILRTSFVFPVQGGGRLDRPPMSNPWPQTVR